MRAFINLLLCFTLAFHGLGHASPIKTPCPMEQAEHVMAMEAADTTGGCCNDAETAATTGKLCKTGQECNLTQFCLPPPTSVSISDPVLSSLVPAAGHTTPPYHPPGVWRPPTFS